jgi:hypothetical protein
MNEAAQRHLCNSYQRFLALGLTVVPTKPTRGRIGNLCCHVITNSTQNSVAATIATTRPSFVWRNFGQVV